MTSLMVDNDLYRRTREAAAAQGKTVDEFVGEVLERALADVAARREIRNGLSVIVVPETAPRIDPARVRRTLEEEGF